MKLRTLCLMGALVGALAVIGCGDDSSGTGGGTAGTGGGTAGTGGGTAGSGGTAGTGGGSGDACAELLARCEAECVPDSGDLAICIGVANDGEIDACSALLGADPGGCPVEI